MIFKPIEHGNNFSSLWKLSLVFLQLMTRSRCKSYVLTSWILCQNLGYWSIRLSCCIFYLNKSSNFLSEYWSHYWQYRGRKVKRGKWPINLTLISLGDPNRISSLYFSLINSNYFTVDALFLLSFASYWSFQILHKPKMSWSWYQ